MEGKKSIKDRLNFLILFILYLIGILIHFTHPFNQYLKFINPIFLVVVFLIVVIKNGFEKKFFIWILSAYVFTLFIEIIGVKTGLIFGEYKYGNSLGIKLFGVPLIIGLNWITLLLGGIGFASLLTYSIFFKSLIVALLMITLDFNLESIAPKLDYWYWENNFVPVQNFVSWFIISYILSFYYFSLKFKNKLTLARYNFLLQLIFFIILQIVTTNS